MQRMIKAYLFLSNVVAAVLLIVTFERLSEAIEVINWHAVPVLKQTHDGNAKQVHVGGGQQLHNDDERALASLGRILAKAQAEAMRTRTEVRIIAAWFIGNVVLGWWCFGRQPRSVEASP
jgi:hypothetical protein